MKQAENIFDKVIIARGFNDAKNSVHYPIPDFLEYRQVENYDGLLTDFINSLGYDVTLVRGLRNANDFQNEITQYRFLQDLKPDLKMVSIFCDSEFEHISSSGVRTLEKYGKEKDYLI